MEYLKKIRVHGINNSLLTPEKRNYSFKVIDIPIPKKKIYQIAASGYAIKGYMFGKETDVVLEEVTKFINNGSNIVAKILKIKLSN